MEATVAVAPPASAPNVPESERLADQVRRRFSAAKTAQLVATRRAAAAKTAGTDVLLAGLGKRPRRNLRRGDNSPETVAEIVTERAGELVEPDDVTDGDIERIDAEIDAEVDGLLDEAPLSKTLQLRQIARAVRNEHEAGNPDVNWYLVKLLFLGGWTLDRIHRECNVSRSWLGNRCAVDGWVEQREQLRKAKSDLLAAKLAADEERLVDEQMLLRRTIGVAGLRLARQKIVDAMGGKTSLGDLAKILPVLDSLLASANGIAPIVGGPGGVNVNVTQQTATITPVAAQYPPESPQGRLLDAWTSRDGEPQEQAMQRVAELVDEWHDDFARLGYYRHKGTLTDTQRDDDLMARLGLGGQKALPPPVLPVASIVAVAPVGSSTFREV